MIDFPAPMPRREIDEMVRYQAPAEGRRGMLRLDFNENTIGCSQEVIEALKGLTLEDLAAYPEYGSITRKVSRHLGLDPDMVVLTNGTDEAIRAIYLAYLSPGDALILPVPTFALFRIHAQILGIGFDAVSYGRDMSFPFDDVMRRLKAETAPRMLVVVNPNNPTGTLVEPRDLERMVSTAAGRGTVVLLDEAYWEYSGVGLIEWVRRFPNLLVIRTFSKAYGLAGLRVGVIAGCKPLVAPLKKIVSPYGVSSLAVTALEAALRNRGYVRRYVRMVHAGRRVVEKGLDRLKVHRFPTRANFLLARFGAEAERVRLALKEEGILVRGLGGGPVTRGCLRVGIGSSGQSRVLVKTLERIFRGRALVFDMDGVLVDVSESYRAAIAATVGDLGGGPVTFDEIHLARNSGSFSDDWALTRWLLAERGVQKSMRSVKRVFQRHYLGVGKERGLREMESWLMPRATLARLARRHPLGIVTSRPREEAIWTMKRFGVQKYFRVVVAREDVGRAGNLKPSPHGLLKAHDALGARLAAYVGDSTSDMVAANAAGFLTVGCRTPGADPQVHDRLLADAGADVLIPDVTRITDVLP
ncbi:MAG: aminotransferase class I/II-fold pyridoxal phosphate-dependent enzyme [Deltaproteobacteria bacterium]|nr:aminotransferase class I/II-fold pyridoxal phosphate-dependent enzyme [Deltaproteobacteria bacterium]